MPRDGFYEESAISVNERTEGKMYMIFMVTSVICLVIGVFLLLFAFGFIPVMLASTVSEEGVVDTFARALAIGEYVFAFLFFVGSGVGFWFLKNRFNVSYDYTFVEDEIRITKVFSGKRRKFLYKIQADTILSIGWVDSEAYENALRSLSGNKPKKCTPNKECPEGKEWIYIVQSTTGEKSMYILECRRQLLENIVFAAGRNKLERK